MALVALVASLIVPSAAAQATSDSWSTHGPTGASVSEPAIDPHHPATVYAGTQSGVFKTTDGRGVFER
jgi:hypothetical protein